MASFDALEEGLNQRKSAVYDYLLSSDYKLLLTAPHMLEAFYSYIRRRGKSLRPAVLMLSCSAVGGDEDRALPAAAAVEVYHTMTLVHDDIIDRDARRRGGPAVHIEFRDRAISELRFPREIARHYGITIALLTGDLQHSLSIALLTDLYFKEGLPAELVATLVRELTLQVGLNLVQGETLDVQFSTFGVQSVGEEAVMDMLEKKTGELYRFAAAAGGMIGLRVNKMDAPLVQALANYGISCGVAFQLQDDVLGLLGDESVLGKPVGSDIREGKHTAIVEYALRKSGPAEQRVLTQVLGKHGATKREAQQALQVLQDLGAIEYAKGLAARYVEQALNALEPLPSSGSKELLSALARYTVEREL